VVLDKERIISTLGDSMKPCSFAVTLMMVVTLVAVSSASADDATELAEEGIEFGRIPWVPSTNS